MLTLFGTTLTYNKIFLGKTDGDQFVTIAEFVSCMFLKYISNDRNLCQDESKSEVGMKPESLVTFHK